MSFEAKPVVYGASIGEVTIGTGDLSLTIGGANISPLCFFEAPQKHPPAIGIEVSDLPFDTQGLPLLAALYEGCSDMAERVARATLHLAEALGRLHEGEIEIAITGVNPHAGEGGLFGREEIDAVRPGVERARPGTKAKLVGPMPAEAAFRAANEGRVHGVVAMLHDQATIASKLLDWGDAVNVTWGLPFVRASVDHGVAYDIAGQGVADAAGMRAAIRLAKKLGAP